MRAGRISYNVMQRSVRKPMKSGGTLSPGFAQYKDCAEIVFDRGKNALTAVNAAETEIVWTDSIIELLFYRVCNQIWCQMAEVMSVSAVFILDIQTDETWLASQIKLLCSLCKKEKISLGQISVSVSEQVRKPVMTLNCLGWKQYQKEGLKENGRELLQELLLDSKAALLAIGHTGMAGAALLARSRSAELSKRYAGGFLDGAGAFLSELSLRSAITCVKEETNIDSNCYFFPVQEGGVFSALWYLADGLGTGFDVDWKQIPIRQETVEICEYYRINPYQLVGDGMLLAAVSEPETMVRRWEDAGYQVSVIGCLTEEKARRLHNDGEIRYLDKPAQDPLSDGGYRILDVR